MAQRSRPGFITLLAGVNMLGGVLALAAAIGFGYVTFDQFVKPQKEERPPEPASDPLKGPPQGMRGPPALPSPPQTNLKQEPIPPVRPASLKSEPLGYFRDRQRYLIRQIPTYELFSIAYAALGGVLALLLIGSGRALLAVRPSGRRLAIIYALLAPLVVGGAAYYMHQFVRGEVQRWDRARQFANLQLREYEQSGDLPKSAAEKARMIGEMTDREQPKEAVTVVYAVQAAALSLGGVYALLLFVAMMLPSVRTAYRPAAPPAPVAPPVEVPPPESPPSLGVPNG